MFEQACHNSDDLTDQLREAFLAHPHAKTYLSFPGCGELLGARLLAEIGDDPTRFRTSAGLRTYAGLAPLTWASGTSRLITHRRICNRRPKTACHRWAFSALTARPAAVRSTTSATPPATPLPAPVAQCRRSFGHHRELDHARDHVNKGYPAWFAETEATQA